MIQSDPIIAVNNVVTSSQWYQSLLGCTSQHGGDSFDVLVDPDSKVVVLCLHQWGQDHPTMIKSDRTPGHGLILYFRVSDLELVRENATKLNANIEEDIHLNPNSNHQEFSVRDLDGYYLTITEHHDYQG